MSSEVAESLDSLRTWIIVQFGFLLTIMVLSMILVVALGLWHFYVMRKNLQRTRKSVELKDVRVEGKRKKRARQSRKSRQTRKSKSKSKKSKKSKSKTKGKQPKRAPSKKKRDSKKRKQPQTSTSSVSKSKTPKTKTTDDSTKVKFAAGTDFTAQKKVYPRAATLWVPTDGSERDIDPSLELKRLKAAEAAKAAKSQNTEKLIIVGNTSVSDLSAVSSGFFIPYLCQLQQTQSSSVSSTQTSTEEAFNNFRRIPLIDRNQTTSDNVNKAASQQVINRSQVPSEFDSFGARTAQSPTATSNLSPSISVSPSSSPTTSAISITADSTSVMGPSQLTATAYSTPPSESSSSVTSGPSMSPAATSTPSSISAASTDKTQADVSMASTVSIPTNSTQFSVSAYSVSSANSPSEATEKGKENNTDAPKKA